MPEQASNQPADFTECVICMAPLGQESRDMRFRTCRQHRACSVCGFTLTAREIEWCHAQLEGEPIGKLILTHMRCSIVTHSASDDPTLSVKQSDLDYLNILRLMVVPDSDLNIVTNENNAMIQSARLIQSMSFDQKLMHLKMLEACVAQCSVTIRTSPEFRKDLALERQKVTEKKARVESITSSRPTSKSADAPEEIALGTFMEMHGLSERTSAKRIYSDRNKAINSLVGLGIPETIAREQINATLVKKGILKR